MQVSEQEYYEIFNHISDALEALEQQNYGQAKDYLILVQQHLEEFYIASGT